VGVPFQGSNRLQSAGKLTDNCYVETFNGSLRDECLNVHWFDTVEEAKVIIEAGGAIQ
jgi:putative transposase